ncbi:MAG: metalloregulator ArsR/SmtB family transcription factor [Patescibacteria group bacterium]
MNSTERILKALANRRRLKIVNLLKTKHRASVGKLADNLKVTLPTAFKHLAILAAADVVEYDRVSLQVYYRLADRLPPAVTALLKFI